MFALIRHRKRLKEKERAVRPTHFVSPVMVMQSMRKKDACKVLRAIRKRKIPAFMYETVDSMSCEIFYRVFVDAEDSNRANAISFKMV